MLILLQNFYFLPFLIRSFNQLQLKFLENKDLQLLCLVFSRFNVKMSLKTLKIKKN